MKYKPGILQTAEGQELKVWYSEDGEWVEIEPELSEQAACKYARKEASQPSPRPILTKTGYPTTL